MTASRTPGEAPRQLMPLRAADLRQYLYCPRVIYFNYVLPVERKVTFKMADGQQDHAEAIRLERRRSLGRYGLKEGERLFGLTLESKHLGLSGRMDMAISTRFAGYVVEFKSTAGGPAMHHKYQLAAYGLLFEEHLRKPVRAGFICVLPAGRTHRIEFTDSVRLHTIRLAGAIRRLITEQRMPPRTRQTGRCVDCEFRRYCADF